MSQSWTRRSDAEKDAEKQELGARVSAFVEELAQRVEAARSQAEVLAFLDFMAHFHTYSANNQILIWLQKPAARRVAGYAAWKSLGRYPKVGTGIKIWAPTLGKALVEGLDGQMQEREVLRGFHLTTVFDVSDTEGKPLPDATHLWVETDACGEELYRALGKAAAVWSIRVEEQELGEMGGASLGGVVAINVQGAMLRKTSALAHELAHELLHQRGSGQGLDRPTRELEAEAAAYVVCAHFGYVVKAAEYIALWQGDAQGIMARLESIRQAASQIIKEVERYVGEQTEPQAA